MEGKGGSGGAEARIQIRVGSGDGWRREARRVKEEEEWQILNAHRPLDGFLVLVLVEVGVVSLAGVFLRHRGE